MPPKRRAATRASVRIQKDARKGRRRDDEDDSEEIEEEEEEVEVKPRRVAKRKAKEAIKESSEEEDEEEEEDKPRRVGKRRAKKASSEEEEEEDNEDEAEEEEAPVKPKATSSAAVWKKVEGTLLVLDGPDIKPSAKIASFDMDDTLINPKSGRAFPTGRADWKWWNAKVPAKLKELHEDGFKLVIFTNQAGITKGKSQAKDITGKIKDLSAELGLPLQVFVATAEDKWRKPSVAMWQYFIEHHNGGLEVDMKLSFYCGDAAGRAKAWDGNAKTKKDHSCSDRKFAHNVDLPFKLPEMLFLGKDDVEFSWGSIDPTSIVKGGKAYEGELTSDSQEMILCVGFPASGKSSFTKRHLVPKGYVHVNQDTQRSKAACLKAARAAVAEGKSVVVDNTNPSATVRAEYLDIAQDHGIPVRCFWFKTPLELAQHMNTYRENVYGVPHVPGVGYNMFKKNFVEPKAKEGFTEIKEITFVPHFADPEKEKLFYLYT